MPQLPEDIIDRLTAMERRIQQLSTAVNTRPALNTISGGEVRISDGGSLSVVEPVNGTKILGVGAWSPTEYGLEIKRKSGKTVLSVRNVVTGDYDQAFRVFDSFNNEIVADDVVAGGLARPWLAMLPPQDTSTTRWPQTNATGWTTVARSFNPIWQPKMRLYCLTAAAAGSPARSGSSSTASRGVPRSPRRRCSTTPARSLRTSTPASAAWSRSRSRPWSRAAPASYTSSR